MSQESKSARLPKYTILGVVSLVLLWAGPTGKFFQGFDAGLSVADRFWAAICRINTDTQEARGECIVADESYSTLKPVYGTAGETNSRAVHPYVSFAVELNEAID